MAPLLRLLRLALLGACVGAAMPASAQGWVGTLADDYRSHYRPHELRQRGLLLSVGGMLANSGADDSMRDNLMRESRGFTLAAQANGFGDAAQLQRALPVYFGVMALGWGAESGSARNVVADWGARSLRAVALGMPEFYLLARTTGAQRPVEGEAAWQPLQDDNGVSGHAFFGAVPLLTAAHMSRQPVLRYGLLAGSMLPGLARVRLDRHYLSQAVVGWGLAYFSTRTVARGGAALAPFEIEFRALEDGGGALFIKSAW